MTSLDFSGEGALFGSEKQPLLPQNIPVCPLPLLLHGHPRPEIAVNHGCEIFPGVSAERRWTPRRLGYGRLVCREAKREVVSGGGTTRDSAKQRKKTQWRKKKKVQSLVLELVRRACFVFSTHTSTRLFWGVTLSSPRVSVFWCFFFPSPTSDIDLSFRRPQSCRASPGSPVIGSSIFSSLLSQIHLSTFSSLFARSLLENLPRTSEVQYKDSFPQIQNRTKLFLSAKSRLLALLKS